MEGCINGLQFHPQGMGDKIHAPDIFPVIVALIKQRVRILMYILFQLVVVFHTDFAKLIVNKMKISQLAKLKIQFQKRSNLHHPLLEPAQLLLDFLPLRRHSFHFLRNRLDDLLGLLRRHLQICFPRVLQILFQLFALLACPLI